MKKLAQWSVVALVLGTACAPDAQEGVVSTETPLILAPNFSTISSINIISSISIKPRFTAQQVKATPLVVVPGGPLVPRGALLDASSVGHGHQRLPRARVGNVMPPPFPGGGTQYGLGPEGPGDTSAECQASHVAGLHGADLVTYLTTHDTGCLYYLWNYTADLRTVFSDTRMTTVFDAIRQRAPLHDGTTTQALEQLLTFVKAGYYHKELSHDVTFTPATIQPTAIQALDAVAASTSFLANNSAAGSILREWLGTVDNSWLGYRFYQSIKNILVAFRTDATRMGIYEQRTALFSAFYLVQRSSSRSEFAAVADAALVETLRGITLDPNHTGTSTWVANNAVWTLGKLFSRGIRASETLSALSAAYSTFAWASEPFLWTVKALTINSDCQNLSDGTPVCRSTTWSTLENQIFPNTHRFDDGALVVRTPLSLAEVQPLYHAAKEVEAQFQRISETFTPIDNDPNPTLTVKLYGTMADYKKYQSLLYGLPTENGGIYIEQGGTFYTFQRTANESIYSLEELFRHEYVHYLAGRFLISGIWGDAPIYSDSRMVWFDEGLAEFLAGSTQDRGVLPREVLVRKIRDDSLGRMSVSQVLAARYGDFRFYQYAGTFFQFLRTSQRGLLKDFLTAAYKGDVARFDLLVSQAAANATMNNVYQQHLNDLVAGISALTNPVTTLPPLGSLSTDSPSRVQNDFRTIRWTTNAACNLAALRENSRFSCRGNMTGTLRAAPDWASAWATFDGNLNEIIGTLKSSSSLNNFSGMVCRMGALRWIPYGAQAYPIVDYYCDGPLTTTTATFLARGTQEQVDFRATRLGIHATCSVTSAGLVTCRAPLSTSTVSNSQPDSVLTAAMNDALIELENSVYGTRPSYYRALSCQLVAGSSRVVAYGSSLKYMVADATCSIKY